MKKTNIYWFWRSLKISAIIVFSIIALFLGMAKCYQTMHKTVTGEDVEIVEIKERKIFVLGKEIPG